LDDLRQIKAPKHLLITDIAEPALSN